MALTVLLGLIALSFDLGRVAITQTELQSYADSVALAAAGELDGKDDAITRARAAANLIADSQTFGNSNNSLQGATDFTLTFLSALPGNDTAATTAVTTDPNEAVYARVDVNSAEVDLTFAAAFAFLNQSDPMQNEVDATAVAGYTQYACDVTPLMFCLPNSSYTAEDHVGHMIHLRAGGQGAAWGPGNFGFLDPHTAAVDNGGPCAGLSGVRLDACLIGAIGSVTQCFRVNGVDTLPGQRAGIEDAIFNVRFDMYGSIMNGERNNPLYAPAPNVIKGLVRNSPGGGGNGNGGGGGGNACVGQNPSVSPDTVGIPRDDCFALGTCTGRFGDGVWTDGRANYVDVNYGGTDPHPLALTRYEYYLAEIQAAGGGGSSAPILSGLSETGRPQCSSHQSNDPERRLVIAAAIDCAANPINGAEVGVPVEEFFRLFLTEPVSNDGASPASLEIHVEVVGPAGGDGAGVGNQDGIFRDVVQLYR